MCDAYSDVRHRGRSNRVPVAPCLIALTGPLGASPENVLDHELPRRALRATGQFDLRIVIRGGAIVFQAACRLQGLSPCGQNRTSCIAYMQLTLNCLSMLLLIKHRSMEVVKVLRTLKASFFLSILLILPICFSFSPSTAYAAESDAVAISGATQDFDLRKVPSSLIKSSLRMGPLQ